MIRARRLHAAIWLPLVLSVVGLFCLGLAFGGVDACLHASSVLAALTVMTGIVSVLSCVAGWAKNGHRPEAMRLVGPAIAFIVCIPQFYLGAWGYGFGGMNLLAELSGSGALVSALLGMATLVGSLVVKLKS